jgi:hypothetical protein
MPPRKSARAAAKADDAAVNGIKVAPKPAGMSRHPCLDAEGMHCPSNITIAATTKATKTNDALAAKKAPAKKASAATKTVGK